MGGLKLPSWRLLLQLKCFSLLLTVIQEPCTHELDTRVQMVVRVTDFKDLDDFTMEIANLVDL